MCVGGGKSPPLSSYFFLKRNLPSSRARPLSTSGGEEGEGEGGSHKRTRRKGPKEGEGEA